MLLLTVQAACATGVPRGGQAVERDFPHWLLSDSKASAASTPGASFVGPGAYDMAYIEPGAVATRPVPINKAEFQRTLQRLAGDVRLAGATVQEAARELLKAHPELEGEWLAEVYRGRVLTLVPLEDTPSLTPEAQQALRDDYLQWCERRGGGDCLGLFEDGPYLRTDDRRVLALALAFGSVLDETQQALSRELDPRALVAMVVWAVGLYLAMWLVPEPTTKAAAAALTVVLVAWLGVDTLWELMDGWVKMAVRAHEATTFAELRSAGGGYSQVMGHNAARTLILAVATLTGRTLGEVAAKVRSLPGYKPASVQWEAQQGGTAALRRVERVEVVAPKEGALAAAVTTVETVAAAPQGPIAVALLKKGAGGGTGGPAVTVALRHRGGNQQVLLANGQRWHLPPGKSPADIPAEDKVGDMLQEAVTRAAKEWGPDKFTPSERAAIDRAIAQGKYWLARLLEREARGRFVETKVGEQFKHLYDWNRNKGIDIVDPTTGYRYEILSGTGSNLAHHGRRMAGEFFRMLTF